MSIFFNMIDISTTNAFILQEEVQLQDRKLIRQFLTWPGNELARINTELGRERLPSQPQA